MTIVSIIMDIKRDIILSFWLLIVLSNKVNWYKGVKFHMVKPLINTQIKYVYYGHFWPTWSFLWPQNYQNWRLSADECYGSATICLKIVYLLDLYVTHLF